MSSLTTSLSLFNQWPAISSFYIEKCDITTQVTPTMASLVKVEGTIHLNKTNVSMIRCSSILRTPSTCNWAGRSRGRKPLIKKDLKREASKLAFGRDFEGVDRQQLGSECQLGRKETPRERGTNKTFIEVKRGTRS
jgi:hypothetical protein